MNKKVYVDGNFNCFVKIERLFNDTGSHVHWKYGNILEMVQDTDVITTGH